MRSMRRKKLVTLYTKPGCHLCDEAKREIFRADCEELYDFEEINIESRSDLFTRYRYDVPVIVVDGVHAFKHRLTSEDFKRALLSD